jgi:nitrate reductase assembly molybdenum cofactor insertion protein NarJ
MRSTAVTDDVHAWLGPEAMRGSGARSLRLQLTDEERSLRDLAYPLIEPPYDRNRWYSVLGELNLKSRPWPYPKRDAYAGQLFETAYRSQTARYNKLIEDIRNDLVRLDPFYSNAHYVLDIDRKREQALSRVSRVSEQERRDALQRIEENRAIVRWVQGSLAERAESYRVALERLVVSAPAPVSIEAERALALLQQRISGSTV